MSQIKKVGKQIAEILMRVMDDLQDIPKDDVRSSTLHAAWKELEKQKRGGMVKPLLDMVTAESFRRAEGDSDAD